MQNLFNKIVYFFFCALISLSALSGAVSAVTLSELENVSTSSKFVGKTNDITGVRFDAIRDTALAIGTQGGLTAQSKAYQEVIEQFSSKLDQLYRFGPLFLKDGILPPVIDEAKNAVVQDSPDIIRYADHIYKIERPERFVTTTPTWRDYLYTGLTTYKSDETIHPVLVPNSSAEKKVWKQFVEMGWLAGTKQADEIFSDNLARLTRDYVGMIRFKILYAKAMVSMPVVNSLYRSTAGSKNEMMVNDKVFRIIEHSGLQLNPKKWKAFTQRGEKK